MADLRHGLQELSLRFQLPQERSTYVDLVDDEDVQLMFDEWQEYASQPTAAVSAKLQARCRLCRIARLHMLQLSALCQGSQANDRPGADPSPLAGGLGCSHCSLQAVWIYGVLQQSPANLCSSAGVRGHAAN